MVEFRVMQAQLGDAQTDGFYLTSNRFGDTEIVKVLHGAIYRIGSKYPESFAYFKIRGMDFVSRLNIQRINHEVSR